MNNDVQIEPIGVHILKDDTKTPEVKREIRISHHTYNVTSGNPATVAGYDPNRVEMRVSVFGAPVVVCSSISEANDAANNIGTLANPNGRILPVSGTAAINASPTPSQPAVPASTTAQYNNNPYAVAVTVTGGTVTVIAVNGVTTGLISGVIYVPAFGTITLTYSVAPTWTWANANVTGAILATSDPMEYVIPGPNAIYFASPFTAQVGVTIVRC